MIQDNQMIGRDDDAIDLVELWGVIWSYKFVIVGITTVCAGIAIVLALTATPIYRAEVVITEVSENAVSPGAALANQFGGLASLAGINIGTGGNGRDARAVLTSRSLIEEFVKRHNLISELYPDDKEVPTMWMAVRQFQEGILSIRDDKRSGTTHVAISWREPQKCAEWANGIVSLADELIRSRALDDSTRSISYLNEQIKKTNVVELQRVMYSLVESETKTLMLANARAEYAFNVVDPAVAPEIRSSPRRTMMVLIGTALGLFIGIVTAFILNRVRRITR